jgi:hypothetical protein
MQLLVLETLHPSEGLPRNVAAPVDMLYPPGKSCRILLLPLQEPMENYYYPTFSAYKNNGFKVGFTHF